jgi:hypothetical protein
MQQPSEWMGVCLSVGNPVLGARVRPHRTPALRLRRGRRFAGSLPPQHVGVAWQDPSPVNSRHSHLSGSWQLPGRSCNRTRAPVMPAQSIQRLKDPLDNPDAFFVAYPYLFHDFSGILYEHGRRMDHAYAVRRRTLATQLEPSSKLRGLAGPPTVPVAQQQTIEPILRGIGRTGRQLPFGRYHPPLPFCLPRTPKSSRREARRDRKAASSALPCGLWLWQFIWCASGSPCQ